MNNQNLTSTFLSYIQPGWNILDLGGGDGHFSKMFVARGAKVQLVDKAPVVIIDEAIIVENISIEDFIKRNSESKYHAVFVRNVIQFLDKRFVFEQLFPWFSNHVYKKGIIGIETFFYDPIPPFERAVCSVYTIKELAEKFNNWRNILIDEGEHYGSDLQGINRKFFISNILIQKLQ